MEKKQASMLLWALATGLLFHNLAIPVLATTFEDQKNYYHGDPHSSSPPSSHRTPSHGGSGHTPSHSTPSTPSGGGGSYNPTPSTPSGGGSNNPTPSTPSGGGSYNPTPSTPSGGNCGTPPSVPTPSTPSNPPRGGGYYPPNPPSSGGGSPPTPVIVSPPTTPSITPPGTPFTPTPPFIPDPNSPFSCNYWRTHPALIWGVLGWWGTMGSTFGVTSLPGFGTSMSLPQALSNTRPDGYGTLYREGAASLLNSMVTKRFPFTTRQVRDHFIAALASNKAAAAQGQLFKLANEGRLKPRA